LIGLLEYDGEMEYIDWLRELSMEKPSKKQPASPLAEKGYVIVEHYTTPGGREVWRVASGGKIINLTTSSSSNAAMDDAVRIYSSALERLAKR
jgi:hypothetical protein